MGFSSTGLLLPSTAGRPSRSEPRMQTPRHGWPLHLKPQTTPETAAATSSPWAVAAPRAPPTKGHCLEGLAHTHPPSQGCGIALPDTHRPTPSPRAIRGGRGGDLAATPRPPHTVSRRPLPVRRAPVGRAQGSRQGPRRQLDVDGEGLHGDPRSPTAPRPCPAPLAGSAAAAAGPSRPAPPPPCGCRTAVPGLPVCGRRVSVFSRNPEPVPGPEQERAPIFLVPHSQPQRPSRGSPRQCLGDEGRPLKLSVIPMP